MSAILHSVLAVHRPNVEPVRLLAGWLLERDGEDLLLRHGGQEIERFHDAIERSTPDWLRSVEESGFCLVIVGAGIGLETPRATAIQSAIREHRALMGLAEFDVSTDRGR